MSWEWARTPLSRSVSADPELVKAWDIRDSTPLHIAAEKGHSEVVALLLAMGADPNARDIDGHTPLHNAASEGLAELLLKAGAEANAKGEYLYSPLHKAAARGHGPTVRVLFAAGARVNAASRQGWTALHCATSGEVAEILLTAGANANAKTNDGWTPLRSAADNGYGAWIKLLLENGADIHAEDDDGRTALRVAQRAGNRPVARVLKEADRGD